MGTTPDIFVDNDLVPDPHNGIYAPRVLGRNGNYVNFINDTSAINDTWLMNPDGNGSSGSAFDGHTYILISDIGYEKNQWLYSLHFGWLYVETGALSYNVEEEVLGCWVWFPATLISGSNPGWFFVFRSTMFRDTYTINGNSYTEDFLLYSYTYSRFFGVTKSGSSILFRDMNTAVQYTFVPDSGTVSPPTAPGGEEVPDFEIPPTPSAGNLSPEGFEQSNLICCGSDHYVGFSRRCSIINGKYGLISPFPDSGYENNNNYWAHGQYNCHIIGGFYSTYTYYGFSNRLHVHCDNGMYVVGGDIVSDRLSDENLKDNKTKIKDATDKINKIQAVSFEWNNKQETYKGEDIGLIAQNIEAVIPEAVENRKTGFKAVQYQKVIPLVIASIKEKQKRIESLKQKIESLKHGKL